MKAIVYIVAIVAACGAAFFSFQLSNKLKALEEDRLATIQNDQTTTAKAEGSEKNIDNLKKQLAASQENEALLTQTVSSLKSAGTGLESDIRKLDQDLKAQDNEFKQLENALAEVNKVMEEIGGGITIDTLPDEIKKIEDDKVAKQTKLEELNTLVSGAESSLVEKRKNLDSFAKRTVERNSNIGRNSMEAVVTAVNQDWGFLVIGAGSNSGFTPQTALLVERDGRMIGRVSPSSVEPTQTIAEIDLESLAAGVRLQPGDRVILARTSAN